MTSLTEEAQSLSPDAHIELFQFDTSSIGGPMIYFVQGRDVNDAVSFGGIRYEAIDIEFKGLETSGVGALPTPSIVVANHDGIIGNLINTWGEPLGCTIYRLRTRKRFLDGHPDADGSAFYGPDVFRVERRVTENPVFIEFELSTSFDQEGKKLPGRQVIRDTCLWRYRVWNEQTGEFDYSKAQCPYTGNKYFDINDNEVSDPALDEPSRRLTCCEKRFGKNNPLPFGGFPGVSRVPL